MVYPNTINFARLPYGVPLTPDDLSSLETEVYTSVQKRGVTEIIEKNIDGHRMCYMLKWCPEWIKLIELQHGKETFSISL